MGEEEGVVVADVGHQEETVVAEDAHFVAVAAVVHSAGVSSSGGVGQAKVGVVQVFLRTIG